MYRAAKNHRQTVLGRPQKHPAHPPCHGRGVYRLYPDRAGRARYCRLLIARGRVAATGPAVRGVMLGLGYVLAALALWMLWQLERLLARLGQGAVFVPANVQALRRIAWCCALAAVICVPAGAALYFPFACMGIAAGFMALIVHVLKNAFEQAVKMQDELDYTV